jgi:hypothetical protein
MIRNLLVLFACAAVACSVSSSDNEAVGAAELAITQVPADVSCIQITVVGGHTVTRTFDVTPGKSSVLHLDALPAGSDVFTGAAYSTACASVTASSVPTWLSSGTPATVASGGIVNVALALTPNGSASVSVDFQADGGAPDACSPANCVAPANGTASCVAGLCTIACNAPFTLCGGTCIPSGGCCTASDCPGIQNGHAVCMNGSCGYACNAGFHDCGDICWNTPICP